MRGASKVESRVVLVHAMPRCRSVDVVKWCRNGAGGSSAQPDCSKPKGREFHRGSLMNKAQNKSRWPVLSERI